MTREFPKNNIALPTVGRIVLFSEHKDSIAIPAIVQSVVGGHTVDLVVFGRGGLAADLVFSVPHKDDREYKFWDWMDYQKGQAAKTEQLQAELEQIVDSTKTQPLSEGRQHVSHRGSDPVGWGDDHLTKNQASTPSPVDGKR
jgi:hypothetical protein